MVEPAYLKTIRSGEMKERIAAARAMMQSCRVCPRNCGVDRFGGELGFCGLGPTAVVASASPHFGEESPLVGIGGSGTIFFTSCNLKCVFCQNYEISHLMEGQELSTEHLGKLMIRLQDMGCHNINFVTPSHFVPAILEAVDWAGRNQLRVPLVYNTGGYDSVESLRLLDGVVDIYMPDLKFMDPETAKVLMTALDYPEVAQAAIKEMHRQVGDLALDDRGVAVKGLLVRHLVMPDGLAGTREAMRFLAKEISADTYVNIMNQYRPCGRAHNFPGINRAVSRAEYNEAVEMAREEGIQRLDERAPSRLRFF